MSGNARVEITLFGPGRIIRPLKAIAFRAGQNFPCIQNFTPEDVGYIKICGNGRPIEVQSHNLFYETDSGDLAVISHSGYQMATARTLFDAGIRYILIPKEAEDVSVWRALNTVVLRSPHKAREILKEKGVDVRIEGLPIKWNDFYREFHPMFDKKSGNDFWNMNSLAGAGGVLIGSSLSWLSGDLLSKNEGTAAVLAGISLGAVGFAVSAAARYASAHKSWKATSDFRAAPADVVSAYTNLQKFLEEPSLTEANTVAGVLARIKKPGIISRYFAELPPERLEQLTDAYAHNFIDGPYGIWPSVLANHAAVSPSIKINLAHSGIKLEVAAQQGISLDNEVPYMTKRDLAYDGIIDDPGAILNIAEHPDATAADVAKLIITAHPGYFFISDTSFFPGVDQSNAGVSYNPLAFSTYAAIIRKHPAEQEAILAALEELDPNISHGVKPYFKD